MVPEILGEIVIQVIPFPYDEGGSDIKIIKVRKKN